jgi:hypothetical protein
MQTTGLPTSVYAVASCTRWSPRENAHRGPSSRDEFMLVGQQDLPRQAHGFRSGTATSSGRSGTTRSSPCWASISTTSRPTGHARLARRSCARCRASGSPSPRGAPRSRGSVSTAGTTAWPSASALSASIPTCGGSDWGRYCSLSLSRADAQPGAAQRLVPPVGPLMLSSTARPADASQPRSSAAAPGPARAGSVPVLPPSPDPAASGRQCGLHLRSRRNALPMPPVVG